MGVDPRLRALATAAPNFGYGTARLAQMNLLLHGIGESHGAALIDVRDALARPPRQDERATLVLANPPFGRKSGFSSVDEFGRVTREDASYDRPDFWVTTSNKQLNFVQHIALLLKIDGRAAVVVPDNVLGQHRGRAGEARPPISSPPPIRPTW